ncbi:hypothetical protein Tco_0986892, partial [Tanacetum coccineum]
DDSEADSESEPAEQTPVSSSHDILTPSSEFPLAPIVDAPGVHRRSATLIRPGKAIRFCRPYRTHLNGPRRLLTARKRVRPIIAHQSISEHTPPDTTDVDTSTPPRFVHQSLARTPDVVRLLDVGGLAPFSTPYLPTTSESSLGSSSERSLDSSSHSSRPSRKRCRSPTVLVLSHTHISRSITPTLVGLLPPRKRFRDSYSPEDSGDEHMEVDTADAKAVTDVEAHAADTREIAIDPLAIGDSSESSRGGIPDLEDT